jgi:large subunit ribosomal protein L1
MVKHGKKYEDTKKKAPEGAVGIDQAVEFLQENKISSFDETMELGVRLGIDPRKSENTVRGTVTLPHGTGKPVRVIAFASGDAAQAAQEAGADEVGMKELIDKVSDGWTDFDVAVATTEAMKEVKKLGRVLGPRGLMPSPKAGTVTDDLGTAVTQSKAGRVEFRMDRHGNINVPFGKMSFNAQSLAENAKSVLSAIERERPEGAKGTYMKNVTVSSTMGVGLRVNVKE